jgi:hypothetical protein
VNAAILPPATFTVEITRFERLRVRERLDLADEKIHANMQDCPRSL